MDKSELYKDSWTVRDEFMARAVEAMLSKHDEAVNDPEWCAKTASRVANKVMLLRPIMMER